MKKEVRDLIKGAAKSGWKNLGMDGQGHFKLQHSDTRETVRVPYSASDWRSLKNVQAELRRRARSDHQEGRRARPESPLRTG